MCMRAHERWEIADARSMDEPGGSRTGSAVMEYSSAWSRDINVKVTRLATGAA